MPTKQTEQTQLKIITSVSPLITFYSRSSLDEKRFESTKILPVTVIGYYTQTTPHTFTFDLLDSHERRERNQVFETSVLIIGVLILNGKYNLFYRIML